MPKVMIRILFAMCSAFIVVATSHAQQSLQTGVMFVGDPVSCSTVANSSKFYPGMTCFGATISQCPGVKDINITFGWTGPAAPAVPQGTIVFFSGDGGVQPTENGDDIPAYAPIYVGNFNIVYVEYMGTPWEDPDNGAGGDILLAACRPATFLSYIDNSSIHQGAMCAQGFSAGSAALAYSMAYYNAGSYLKNAEFLAGPVLSEIDQGCTYGNTYTPTICAAGSYCSPNTQPWSDSVVYVYPNYNAINTWSGLQGCAMPGGSGNIGFWKSMSIVDAGIVNGVAPSFYYQSVKKHGWLCSTLNQVCPGGGSSCANNSSAQGKYFYDAINLTGDNQMHVTGITYCQGPEGVAQGVDPDFPAWNGAQAVENDMLTNCHQ